MKLCTEENSGPIAKLDHIAVLVTQAPRSTTPCEIAAFPFLEPVFDSGPRGSHVWNRVQDTLHATCPQQVRPQEQRPNSLPTS